MTGVSRLGLGGNLFLLGMKKEAMEGPGMFGGRKEEVSGRSRDISPAAVEFAMVHDEIRGNPVTEKVAGAAGMIHPDCEILVYLEVKMGRVHSVIVADGAYLLPPCYLLSLPHHNPVEMSVE